MTATSKLSSTIICQRHQQIFTVESTRLGRSLYKFYSYDFFKISFLISSAQILTDSAFSLHCSPTTASNKSKT